MESNLGYLLDLARDLGGNLEVSNLERRYSRVLSLQYLGYLTTYISWYIVMVMKVIRYRKVLINIRLDQYETFKRLKEIRGVPLGEVLRDSLDDYLKLASEQANV